MILNISENIGQQSLDKLVQFINQLPNSEPTIPHYIYLKSRGGEWHFMEAILHILNTQPNIFLVGYGELLSCAFDLFFFARCDKTIMHGTIGMYHQSRVSIGFGNVKRGRKRGCA